MLVEKTKKAVGRLFKRSGSLQGTRKQQLRKLIHESLEDRRVMAAAPLAAAGVAYTQDFNTLATSATSTTLPLGWALSEVGTSAQADGAYAAGNGGSNGGNVYSFGTGTDTDRAFGTLLSGSLTPTIGASFQNTSGSTFAGLNISYTGEMWRAGAPNRGAADRLDFQISLNATSLTDATATWVDVDALDYNSSNISTATGALDGNAAGNRTVISTVTIPSLNIANNQTFWIRWNDFNIASSDDGLAIDDFSLTPTATATPGVTIAQTDGSTVVGESGTADTYTIVLQSQPNANVTVNINPQAGQLNTSAASVLFTSLNWNTPQTVTINAINDSVFEGAHTATITHSITSTATGYTGLSVPSLTVSIIDNDLPSDFALNFNGNYSQDFDTLSTTGAAVPNGLFPVGSELQGWGFGESSTNANFSYSASDGGSNAGDTYSFGAADDPERAFGVLASSNLSSNVGVLIKNTTGAPLTSINVAYAAELWRVGFANEAKPLRVEYSTTATSLADLDGWIEATDLSTEFPGYPAAGALNGNDAANRLLVDGTITGLNIPVNGTFWIRWNGQDQAGTDNGWGIDDVQLSTGATNTAPTISAIADQNVAANTPTAALPFTVGDAETAPAALTVTAASSNTTLVPVANVVFGGSGANRTVTVTPANGQSGSATITLTVSDGSLTSIETFVVNVSAPVNTAPTISSIADQTIVTNSSTGALAFTVGDAQTAPGSLTVTRASSNTTLVPVGNVVLGGSGANRTVTITPAAGQTGTTTITLTVSDGELQTSTTFVVTVNAPVVPPKVESVVFGDGTAQRSMVKQVVVTFDKVVTLDTGAFVLQRRVGAALTSFSAAELTINVASTTVSGKTVATLTFTGSLIVGNSLSDGNWQLTVASNKVHAGGADLDGDGNGTAGDNYVKGAVAADNFFRLFGDTNGNRLVNAIEFNQFRQTNGLTSASPNYNARFDYQSNNVVNALDFNQFRLRNGTTLPG